MGETSKVPYVSIIRIDGKPILPPIVTPELKKELHRYRQQAVKLEQRLKNCRELKKHLNELLEAQSDSTRPLSQLTFTDNSHIEALDISTKPTQPRKLKNIHLSKDLIEVTQYNANGLKTICSNMKLMDNKDDTNNDQTCDKETKHKTSNNVVLNENSNNETDYQRCKSASELRKESQESDLQKPSTPPKPKLIRSNSYTLESPSPILLEHLKKTSCKEFADLNFSNLASSRNWASLENNHTAFESSDFSSINTVFHRDINDKSDVASSPDQSAKEIDEVKSPTIEVYQTDISVQQITVNTNTVAPNGLHKEEKREIFFNRNPFDVFEPDSELLNVLKDIPDTYANQIIELLRKQHIEQKDRLERYDKMNEKSDKLCLSSNVYNTQNDWENCRSQVDESKHVNQDVCKTANCDNLIDFSSLSEHELGKQADANSSPITRPNTAESNTSSKPPNEKLRRSSTFSMSPSQSLYYSITSDCDTLTTREIPEVENHNGQANIELGVLRQKNGYWEGVLKHDSIKQFNCSRELFPEIDPVTINAMKQEWAARIIGAHVRGYLTRRLIKTEKVQALIATVKDVLMCALELHHSDNIDEKDVELHRRLINQLSAALYSFHDIFFELAIPEQMAIIAADRQRKREKLKRPQSGRSSTRSKSISSSRSEKSASSSRSSSKHKLFTESPSLTKV